MEDFILRIREEKVKVASRAGRAKLFLELADPARLSRGREILKAQGCKITGETPDQVLGLCKSQSSGEFYEVSFRVTSHRVRGFACGCSDAKSGEVCKHAMALCSLWFLQQKEIWETLNGTEKSLERILGGSKC